MSHLLLNLNSDNLDDFYPTINLCWDIFCVAVNKSLDDSESLTIFDYFHMKPNKWYLYWNYSSCVPTPRAVCSGIWYFLQLLTNIIEFTSKCHCSHNLWVRGVLSQLFGVLSTFTLLLPTDSDLEKKNCNFSHYGRVLVLLSVNLLTAQDPKKNAEILLFLFYFFNLGPNKNFNLVLWPNLRKPLLLLASGNLTPEPFWFLTH